MADTDTEPLHNGNAALSAEEEEERMKQRPADIDADVREMERRKRVEALMSSRLFREELERVLDQQLAEGGDAPLLQRIKEMVGGRLHAGGLRGPSCVLPINDIRGIEGVGYEKGEKILRCKLAAVYRLVDLFGWTQTGMPGQITARLNTAVEQVLTTPRGLLPHEVTASSLVKVDMQGVVHDQGTTNFPVHTEGFSLHAAVHAARPDVRCVLHVRSAAALSVSATRRGLLPLCHEAALLGVPAYHRVPHGNLDNEECEKLVRALGPSAKVLFLSCGGALCCGATLEEAFFQARNLTTACDVQLRLSSLPLEELSLIDEETRQKIYESGRTAPSEGGAKWRVGGEEFEALMRMLDNAGFRTGHIYRHPLIKNDVPRPKNDVEVPPAVSSLGYLLEEEELYRQGIWKKGHGKVGERTRWLNSPNVYQKVEVLETGTTDPKKITKWVDANNEEWVQDGSPAHSGTPVKIDTLQFVPKNTNPKEFKKLQQLIKDNRRADKISAGPQSHILEGVTWDEASKLVGEDAANTHTQDHVVLMGAASKGIIQRGYQHNATVFSAPYARNPFDHVTDREIDEYKRTVERKQRSDYDTDFSESEALQLTSPAGAPSETEDESRDEHRVLRIETKQVPVRSQPEVVLSDVDTTDFLHSERSHADSTRGTLTETKCPPEMLTNNNRSIHDYSRNANFEAISKIFDRNPKCRVSLNSRLNDKESNPANYESRSSLCSVLSLDWDARRSDTLRTMSLPRQNKKLYRTRSYGGFINAYIKDPEPMHYHLPRCRSCGSSSSFYNWEGDSSDKTNQQSMVVTSDEEAKIVKIKETLTPVLKVDNQDSEFVESQEFTEDNYIGEIGSFSTENQTVIEKTVRNDGVSKVETFVDAFMVDVAEEKMADMYRAELVRVSEESDNGNNDTESEEGEYHSFTDDMYFEEAVYVSPVKELVEKDIRDYSVPIGFYCDDYSKHDKSPKKSPQKKRDAPNNTILEPILEESKSSYGDESSISNNESNKSEIEKEIDTHDFIENIIMVILTMAVSVQCLDECVKISECEKFQRINIIADNNTRLALEDVSAENLSCSAKEVNADNKKKSAEIETADPEISSANHVYGYDNTSAQKDEHNLEIGAVPKHNYAENELSSAEHYSAQDNFERDTENDQNVVTDSYAVPEATNAQLSASEKESVTIPIDITAQHEINTDNKTSSLQKVLTEIGKNPAEEKFSEPLIGTAEIVHERDKTSYKVDDLNLLTDNNTGDGKSSLSKDVFEKNELRQFIENKINSTEGVKSQIEISSGQVDFGEKGTIPAAVDSTEHQMKTVEEQSSLAKTCHEHDKLSALEDDQNLVIDRNISVAVSDDIAVENESIPLEYVQIYAETFRGNVKEQNELSTGKYVSAENEASSVQVISAETIPDLVTNTADDDSGSAGVKDTLKKDKIGDHGDDRNLGTNNIIVEAILEDTHAELEDLSLSYAELSVSEDLYSPYEKLNIVEDLCSESKVPVENADPRQDISATKDNNENPITKTAETNVSAGNKSSKFEDFAAEDELSPVEIVCAKTSPAIKVYEEEELKLATDLCEENQTSSVVDMNAPHKIEKLKDKITYSSLVPQDVKVEVKLDHADFSYAVSKTKTEDLDNASEIGDINKLCTRDITPTKIEAESRNIDLCISENNARFSIASSVCEQLTFDSTVEFEKHEIVADLILCLLDKIDYENEHNLFKIPEARTFKNVFRFDMKPKDKSLDAKSLDVKTSIEMSKFKTIVDETQVQSDTNEEFSDYKGDDDVGDNNETFSIAKIIENIEQNNYIKLNDTVLTDTSDTGVSPSFKVVEGILYHIFDMVYFSVSKSNKCYNKNKHKKVVTVVDGEDILYTAKALWPETANLTDFIESADDYFLSILFGSVEKCISGNINQEEFSTNVESNMNVIFDVVKTEFLDNDFETKFESKIFDTTFSIHGIPYEYQMNDSQEALNKSNDHENAFLSDSFEYNEYTTEDTENVNSLGDCNNLQDSEKHLNETFILDSKEKYMNTAFIEEGNILNGSSSPNNEISFICHESPIERQPTIKVDANYFDSPFVKKAPVISMSQTEHSGGIKYWISFDEKFQNVETPRSRKKSNDRPSFIALDLNDEDRDVKFNEYERDSKRCTSVFVENKSETFAASCCSTDYHTCEDYDVTDQKKLLYDTREDRKCKRLCYSWPPYEETLFYRVISKFRMSESFDPSEFECCRLDNSI